MSKKDLLRVDGSIIEVLPATTFKVELEGGHVVLASIGGKLRQHNIRISLGDKVEVEMSPYDMSRGRIVYRK